VNRIKKLLEHVDRARPGVEIGPSYNPAAPKKDGFDVAIIDHISQAELREKYSDEDVDIDNIEEVDFIWRGEPYAELTGKPNHYGWVIASHVIEHSPNLVGFLNECDSLLAEDGVLSLAVPDRRYCFDYYRPLSGISRVIDAHLEDRVIHTAGTVLENLLYGVRQKGKTAWGEGETGSKELLNDTQSVVSNLQQFWELKEYRDSHAWCFVPHSFRLLIHDLHLMGLIQLQEVGFHPSSGCEFTITLGRKGRSSGLSRLEMMDAMDREIRQPQGRVAKFLRRIGGMQTTP
jgi:predicted SAM-dependent methyltransferase